MFAAYNRWANKRSTARPRRFSDDEYRADRGALFKSMHGMFAQSFAGRDGPALDLVIFQRETDFAALLTLA